MTKVKAFVEHTMYLQLEKDQELKDFLVPGLKLIREPYQVWIYGAEKPVLLWRVEYYTKLDVAFLVQAGVLRFSAPEKALRKEVHSEGSCT